MKAAAESAKLRAAQEAARLKALKEEEARRIAEAAAAKR